MNIELHVDSIAIPCVNRVKYLGVYVISARSYKVCWYEYKKNFFRLQTPPAEISYLVSFRSYRSLGYFSNFWHCVLTQRTMFILGSLESA